MAQISSFHRVTKSSFDASVLFVPLNTPSTIGTTVGLIICSWGGSRFSVLEKHPPMEVANVTQNQDNDLFQQA